MPSEKPPKPTTIEKPTTSVDRGRVIEDLRRLRSEFDVAFAEGRKTKDLSQAKKLKEEIEAKFAEIEGSTKAVKGKKEKKKQTAEELSPYVDEIRKEHEDFLSKTFEGWYDRETAKKTKQEPLFLETKNTDYEALSKDVSAEGFGQYTVDPELVGLGSSDFEEMEKEGKIKVLDLAEFQGKPLHEVGKHLIETYADKYYVPGIEFWEWVVNNPDKAPKTLKDGNYHFFFGSVLRYSGGGWCVPYARWLGGEFARSARVLGYGWNSNCRVVLLEK